MIYNILTVTIYSVSNVDFVLTTERQMKENIVQNSAKKMQNRKTIKSKEKTQVGAKIIHSF